MKPPRHLLLASLLGAVALVAVSCSDEDDPMAAKGVPVEPVGDMAAAQPQYVREIVSIFVIHCAGLRQNWPLVLSAKADLVEGAAVRRDVRHGWDKEVRLEIVTKADGLPDRYDYAAGKTLVYFIGLGRQAGAVTADVAGQKLCNMPVDPYFDSFLPISALNGAQRPLGS